VVSALHHQSHGVGARVLADLNDASSTANDDLDGRRVGHASGDPVDERRCAVSADCSARGERQGRRRVSRQGEAAAAGQQGRAESKASQGQIDAQQQLINYAKESYAKLDDERQQMRTKIENGEIDPNRYMKNHSKVQIAIGLILGGLGGTSSASDFLQQQIGKDIEAQKSQIANHKELLANTMQQFGNMEHLTDHLRVMHSDMYSAQLKKAAADTMDPMAKARALQEAGKLDMQVAPIQAQMAQRQAVFRGMQNGVVSPSQAVPFLVPQEHQKEVYSEIKKAQDVQQLEQPILENFDKAAKENTIARTGAGMLRTPPSVQTLSAMYLPMIHDAEGRVNEYEAKTLHDLTPQPGDTDSKIAAKRNGLIQFMIQKRATPTADSFGIRIPKSSAGKFNRR